MKTSAPPSRPERGFSLIVTLILLVVLTLVALASMRSVALESRMSATTYDRNLAFQGAETSLREAETKAINSKPSDFPAANCASGFCAAPAPGDTARWADDAFAAWQNATATVSDKAATPGLIVEQNGLGENWFGCAQEVPRQPNCMSPRFRVTGRSTADGRSTVLLQSDVATP
jgi:type IV pilus assembly protein PilX